MGLTKISWRLTSRKSFMLNKLQTRNVEIKKRKDKGEDFDAYLPDHMKAGSAPAEESEPAVGKKKSSIGDVEAHLSDVEKSVGELDISDVLEAGEEVAEG